MMQNFEKVLWWLIGGTRGGKNRLKIIMMLEEKPANNNQISEQLDLDYKTVRHHIDLMKEHGVITEAGEGYGKNYFLTEKMEQNLDKLEEIANKAEIEI